MVQKNISKKKKVNKAKMEAGNSEEHLKNIGVFKGIVLIAFPKKATNQKKG